MRYEWLELPPPPCFFMSVFAFLLFSRAITINSDIFCLLEVFSRTEESPRTSQLAGGVCIAPFGPIVDPNWSLTLLVSLFMLHVVQNLSHLSFSVPADSTQTVFTPLMLAKTLRPQKRQGCHPLLMGGGAFIILLLILSWSKPAR